jgi:hypothetical protein
MILETSILSKDNETLIRGRASAFFSKLGYKLKRSDTALIFQRGSSFGTWLAFSPMYWKVEILVEFKRESPGKLIVSVIYIIKTAGQLVTRTERRFWSTELEGAERALRAGEIVYGESIKLANDAINQNLLSYLTLGTLSIVLGFIGLFIVQSLAATLGLMLLGLATWWIVLRQIQKRI